MIAASAGVAGRTITADGCDSGRSFGIGVSGSLIVAGIVPAHGRYGGPLLRRLTRDRRGPPAQYGLAGGGGLVEAAARRQHWGGVEGAGITALGAPRQPLH